MSASSEPASTRRVTGGPLKSALGASGVPARSCSRPTVPQRQRRAGSFSSRHVSPPSARARTACSPAPRTTATRPRPPAGALTCCAAERLLRAEPVLGGEPHQLRVVPQRLAHRLAVRGRAGSACVASRRSGAGTASHCPRAAVVAAPWSRTAPRRPGPSGRGPCRRRGSCRTGPGWSPACRPGRRSAGTGRAGPPGPARGLVTIAPPFATCEAIDRYMIAELESCGSVVDSRTDLRAGYSVLPGSSVPGRCPGWRGRAGRRRRAPRCRWTPSAITSARVSTSTTGWNVATTIGVENSGIRSVSRSVRHDLLGGRACWTGTRTRSRRRRLQAAQHHVPRAAGVDLDRVAETGEAVGHPLVVEERLLLRPDHAAHGDAGLAAARPTALVPA